MKNPSTFFRAVKDYRRVTEAHPECLKHRKEIADSGKDGEKIEVERTICRVNTDWIEEIEKGLVYVEKALREERQFIRSNGEVVPIEKVKHISKSSIEHLARHSEFITRDSGEDIIPDQIYTVERLTDYAVYENKFLYMMLCYLRDFVQLRYSTILEAVTTYKGKAEVKKTVRVSKSTVSFSLSLDETTLDDEYLLKHNEAKDTLDRIDLIYKTILLFLSFPLMQEVAKTPPLRPPVTKTNVLKMNHNFKNSLALYDYIRAYEGDGFTLEKSVSTISGFKKTVADEFAELVSLSSFLTYSHGLEMQEHLQEVYEKEEQKRRRKEQDRLEQQLASLKKRVAEEGIGLEEYALLLEKRNKALREDSEALVKAQTQIENLEDRILQQQSAIEQLALSIKQLKTLTFALEAEIESIHLEAARYHDELTADFEQRLSEQRIQLESAFAQTVAALEEQSESYEQIILNEISAYEDILQEQAETYEAEITRITAARIKQIEAYRLECEDRIKDLNAAHKAQLEDLNALLNQERTDAKLHATELATQLQVQTALADGYHATIDQLKEERLLLEARNKALRQKTRSFDGTEEFVREDNFNRIEEEYLAFKAFFKKTWRETKKDIRKKAKQDFARRTADASQEPKTDAASPPFVTERTAATQDAPPNAFAPAADTFTPTQDQAANTFALPNAFAPTQDQAADKSVFDHTKSNLDDPNK